MRLMHPKTPLANTSRTLAVLLEVYLHPGEVVLPIGQRVNLSRSAVQQHLERLAEEGLIEPGKTMVPHAEDYRKSLTRMPVATAKGVAVLEQLVGVL